MEDELWQPFAGHIAMKIASLGLLSEKQWPPQKQATYLYTLSNSVEKHYHTVTIPKRNGGSRHLTVPDVLLAKVQRGILDVLLEEMPLSVYAIAYRKGMGIKENAIGHLAQKQVLKLDIADFFDQIDFAMVYRYAFPAMVYPTEMRGLLTGLCCYKGFLPQGAPTSPMISNLVLKAFDEQVGRYCLAHNITYTRYCDDLIFSGDFDTVALKRMVKKRLYQWGLVLNEGKTQLLTHSQRQLVTGIVVNEKPQVSRGYRRRVRQTLYYCRKYGIDSHLQHVGDERYIANGAEGRKGFVESLLGQVNFILYVNPQDQFFDGEALWLKSMLQDMVSSQ